ncbi:MAG: glutamate-5-semialdehyde dehydrogenase [Deinococcus sp.]|nr:glutamate-5-semialdehyde dehydrogenase [Deinococcus sp.]
MQTTVDVASMAERARSAGRSLARADRNALLLAMGRQLKAHQAEILAANAEDLASATGTVAAALLDRLMLNEKRLDAIITGLHQVAALPDPLGEVLEGRTLSNGLLLQKVRVPLGVIGVVYESRPNVTVDVAALCLKAGSAVLLRGSATALHSNRALIQAIRVALAEQGLDPDCVQLVDDPDRASVTALLGLRGKLDLIIPRGGSGLINHVVENSLVPVVETGIGNCHVYLDDSADPQMASDIVFNAKVQRPSVCNAAEKLLIHQAIAPALLPSICTRLAQAKVEIRGCERTRALYPTAKPAATSDWDMEYLDLIIGVRVVDSLEDAIGHINRHGSQHSEAIVTQNYAHAEKFLAEVDAAAVYVNASTRFTDGFEFGLGAEVGISTQKLHARGPMGLRDLTTTKYLVRGSGQIRQ